MASLIIRHGVRDFDAWNSASADRERDAIFFANGVTSYRKYRDSEDPNVMFLVFELADLEKFQRFLQSSESQTAKDKHGVIAPLSLGTEI